MTYLKKFGIISLFTLFACIPTQAMMGAVPTAAALGESLAKELVPIINDMVQATITKITETIRGVISKDARCKTNCQTLSSKVCTKSSLYRTCKVRCQKIVRLGSGYSLKLRYGPGWDLSKCINYARTKSLHTQKDQSKNNDKEIAIYNERDRDRAIEIISEIQALDKIATTSGLLDQKIKKLTPAKRKELLDNAKKGRDDLIKSFDNQVFGDPENPTAKTNFGPQ